MSKDSAYFKLANLNGEHDLKHIKKELDTLPGVISVSVNKEKNHVAVDYDSTGVSQSEIASRLSKIGYNITSDTVEKHIM